jgi:hypothetical protein
MGNAPQRGKSIVINHPPLELRKRIEAEAELQNRSINNLLIVILTKFFRSVDQQEAGHAQR